MTNPSRVTRSMLRIASAIVALGLVAALASPAAAQTAALTRDGDPVPGTPGYATGTAVSITYGHYQTRAVATFVRLNSNHPSGVSFEIDPGSKGGTTFVVYYGHIVTMFNKYHPHGIDISCTVTQTRNTTTNRLTISVVNSCLAKHAYLGSSALFMATTGGSDFPSAWYQGWGAPPNASSPLRIYRG